MHYPSETTEEKLERQLKQEQACCISAREKANALERSNRALKGHVTRLKKKVAWGGGEMREIKFKVWDNKENSWVTPIIALHYSGLLLQNIGDNCNLIGDLERYDVLLYAGLKAKNGDIYEGDIVEYLTESGPSQDRVEWVGGLACWCLMPLNNTINKGSFLHSIGNDVVEIIGNIYENPELLSTPEGQEE